MCLHLLTQHHLYSPDCASIKHFDAPLILVSFPSPTVFPVISHHPSIPPLSPFFFLPLLLVCVTPFSLHISPCRHHRLYPSRSVFITRNIALSVPLSTVSQSVTPFLYLSPAYRSISASLNIFLCASSSSHVCIMPLLCFAPCVSSSDSLLLLSIYIYI